MNLWYGVHGASQGHFWFHKYLGTEPMVPRAHKSQEKACFPLLIATTTTWTL